MYDLSAFCFVCLSMDKKKKLNVISDLSIFHMLNSCSYDTNWMEDSFTMYICRKCHNQLYSVYEFIEMCRKNSSILQGYVELLKHGTNDIAQPLDRPQAGEMVKMEVVIDLDTVKHELEDDISINMISASDTVTDSISEPSLTDQLDVDLDIKQEPLHLQSDSDSESNHVQMIDKRDRETLIRNEKHRDETAENIQIEHIRDHNEILVTSVLDEDHNIKTQFSSHSDAIYINNNIENNTVQHCSFNKVYLQNPIAPINEMQRRENDRDHKINVPVFSNVSERLVQKDADSLPVEYRCNQGVCSIQSNKRCELKRISDKVTSEPVEYNKKLSVPCATDNMFYIMMPVVPTSAVPNIPVREPVPLIKNNVGNSIKNSAPLAATTNRVRNWKRKLEPPRKCDICQKTYDSHDGLRLHLVTHSGIRTVTPEKTPMQTGDGRNKKETYEAMFIKHMLKTGSL